MESIPRIPDTHIDVDVDSRPCYTISDRNNPVIPLSLTSSDGLEQDCTWNYEPLTGSLKFGNTLYMHDPSTVDVGTTIGFGVTRYTEKEENFWSIFYIRSDGQGKGKAVIIPTLLRRNVKFVS
ncbi:hypothetical protein BC938DRAFT_471380 [Jimgerdemannia flammicorona]|uniref:Uncharacterized protein n=1 Tax=Jimgerdemannia flammicorona TaxID=994334 RepID=A0A433QUT3_9FUNG|nr:hypothetical protein BC938DRAFT_471380 [Jimgerdemannia flammicorona]